LLASKPERGFLPPDSRHSANYSRRIDRLYFYLSTSKSIWVAGNMLNQREQDRIYAKVKGIIADNLHINEDAVHERFQFNKFIDNLATYRIQKAGNHHLLYYLEAVNIYFDLSEEFKVEFPISLMDQNDMTVQELVEYILDRESVSA
jgi:hypothetical protein